MVENSRNRRLYKIEIYLLKILPALIACIYLLNITLSYFCIEVKALNYIGHLSIIPMIFIFVSSYVFKFCEYHRMPLYYIIVNNLISIIDLYIGIPVSDYELLMIHSFIAGISIIITIILYVKCNKSTASKDYR